MFDLDAVLVHLAERSDECGSKSCVCYERNAEVYGTTSNLVAVVQFVFCEVLWYVDDKVELFVFNHVKYLEFAVVVIGPSYELAINSIVLQEIVGS